MALLGIDGFDYYAASQSGLLGWSGSPLSMQTGRYGTGQCARLGTATAVLAKTLAAAVGTLTVGFAHRRTNLNANALVLSMRDAGTVQVDLRMAADGSGNLSVTRAGTVLATTTTPLVTDVWYHIVLKVVFSNTGSYELWVNGVSVLSNGSVDTTNTANNTANSFTMNPPGTGSNDYDDFWWRDDATNSGDIRIEALRPNGNGNSSQLTGSDGNSIDNYLLVDDTTHNSDTDYVESSTAGHIDTYAMSDLPTTATSVLATAVRLIARKTDAGARTGRTVVRVSSTNYEGSDIALGDTYAVHSTLRTVNPNTAAAWTGAEINDIEAGVKVQT